MLIIWKMLPAGDVNDCDTVDSDDASASSTESPGIPSDVLAFEANIGPSQDLWNSL